MRSGWFLLFAAACGPAGVPVVSAPAGAAANVALGTTVGLVRYYGDCGRYSDAGGADCFRGGYPRRDDGEVRIESPAPDRDGGVPMDGAASNCAFPPAGVRSLVDWSEARAGEPYALELEYLGEWVARRHDRSTEPRPPALDLQDADDHPEFSQHSGLLGVTLLLKARNVQHTTERESSLVTWTARVVGVCRLE
jgi:hypothetical protein